jgi:hypothetical protein
VGAVHPSMAPMRFLVLALILVSVGCKAHTPPDAALTARLRPAVEAACVAMGLPEAQRPSGRTLDDQVGLLAMRLSDERVRQIDTGMLDRAGIIAGYRAALARRMERRSRSEPPRLLTFLAEQPQWSADQTLLAAALLAQYEQEAKLAPPPPGLAH